MSDQRNQAIYNDIAAQTAQLTTQQFSTSFGSALKLIKQPKRQAIYNIYGYVRLADELVDTWRPKDMSSRLDAFEAETLVALKTHYSTNPIIHAFVGTARQYGLKLTFIKAFLKSMRTDITSTKHSPKSYQTYIYGSAEVVGLMCLQVFCDGQGSTIKKLTPGAQALGAAFQKVNFLRDISQDKQELGRSYFPENIRNKTKDQIVREIRRDLTRARHAITDLPSDCRYAVWLAYKYYEALLNKIDKASVQDLATSRIRVSDQHKSWLFAQAYVHYWLNLGR